MDYNYQPIKCPDGKVRKARVFPNKRNDGPTTLAQVSVKGKMVSGWVDPKTKDFVVDETGVNKNVFSPLYKTRKGFLKVEPEFTDAAPATVQALNLYALQQSQGKFLLSDMEILKVCALLDSFAQTMGVGMICNPKRMQAVLRKLHTLPECKELASVELRPKIAIDVDNDWAQDLTEVLGFINLHSRAVK